MAKKVVRDWKKEIRRREMVAHQWATHTDEGRAGLLWILFFLMIPVMLWVLSLR